MTTIEELSAPWAGGSDACSRAFAIPVEEGWVFAISSRTIGIPRANVVIVPPYATNSHELFLYSYYLLQNGFNVFRFDGINNVGLSSGTIEHYTISQLDRDLGQVVDTLCSDKDLPLIIVAQSLSFPVALRYSMRDPRISKVISILGVVNVRDTIERVIGRSLDPWISRSPEAPVHQCIFGHHILGQNFVDDSIAGSYFDIGDVLASLQRSRASILMLSSTTDEYVRFDDILRCKNQIERPGKLVIMPETSHLIGRSLAVAKRVAKLMVALAADEEPGSCALRFANLTDVISAASVEAAFLNHCERQLDAKRQAYG